MEIGIEIQETDALKVNADVLVLKYAQEFFGADSLAFPDWHYSTKTLKENCPNQTSFFFWKVWATWVQTTSYLRALKDYRSFDTKKSEVLPFVH